MDDKPKATKKQYYYAVHIPYRDSFSGAIAYKFGSKAERDKYVSSRVRDHYTWYIVPLSFIKENNIPLAKRILKF